MAYRAVCLACILVVAFIPAVGEAQSFPVGVELPSLGGLSGGGSFAPASDPNAACGLDFLVGYLVTNHHVGVGLTTEEAPLAGRFLDLSRQFPVQGLWLALCGHCRLSEQFGVFARGSWLIPSYRRTNEDYQFLTSFLLFFDAQQDGRFFGFDVVDPGSRTWAQRLQWCTIDAGGTYTFASQCAVGNLSLIGGFRFDSFQVIFKDPSDLITHQKRGRFDPDLTATSYIPYVGLLVQQGSSVRVGFIGFPYVPGTVKYTETFPGLPGFSIFLDPLGSGGLDFTGSFRNSYFMEAFAEYGLDIAGGRLGIFGIWTYLHGRADVSANYALNTGGGVPSQTFDFSFDRQNWILGGKFGVNFTSPI